MKTLIKNNVISFSKFKAEHPRFIMAVLVFIIIPICASVFLGYEMKADVAVSIPTVVIDNDKTQFSSSYINYIEESQYFHIVKYADEYDELEKMIYEGKAYAGVIIPDNFYQDMREGKAPKILTVYDGSTMAVIVSSKAAMMEMLLTVKAGYMVNIFEGKQNVVPGQVMNQVMPINTTSRMLYNPAKSFRNFILPGLLAAIVQVAMAITGAERGYENQRKNLSMRSQAKIIFGWSLAGALSVFLCLSVQWIFFGMPYRGTVIGGIILTLLFSISITLLGYIMGSFFNERAFCTQISCILVLPTAILGGYTWPVLAMPSFVQTLVKLIPFTYYGEAIRCLCLKPMEFHHIIPDIKFMLIFIAMEILVLHIINCMKNNKTAKMEGDAYAW